MRQFNEFEKRAIGYMIKSEPTSLFQQNVGTIINNIYWNNNVNVTIKNANLILEIYESSEQRLDFVLAVKNDLTSLMNLIKYLESLFLISLDTDLSKIGQISNKPGLIRESINISEDQGFNRFYYSYFNSYIFISNDLRYIVANEFKTSDQIIMEKQLKEAEKQTDEARAQTKKASINTLIALLALVAAIISVVKSICK